MRYVLLCLLAFALASCKSPGSKPTGTAGAAISASNATAAAISTADAASAAESAKKAERDSRVRASVDTAAAANEGNPDGTPKTVVREELRVAAGLLQDATQEDLAAAAERRAIVESGKAAEAREAYAKANAEAVKLVEGIAKAEAAKAEAMVERDRALAAEKAALTTLAAQLEQNKRDQDQRIQQLKDEYAAERKSKIISGMRWLGLGCIAAGIVFIAITKGTELTRGLLFICGGILSNAGALLLNHWLFPWVAWGSLALVTIGAGLWFYHEYKHGRIKRVSGDLVEAIEEVRTKLKSPSADAVAAVMSADTHDKAKAVISNVLKSEVDETLRLWVTENDGTAATVDKIRREKGLL